MTPSSLSAVSRTLSVTTFNNDGRFHLATVHYSKPLQSDYLPTTLTSMDYPNLIAEGETVDTIAVPAVLAAYNWEPNTERGRKLALFVDAFFKKFAALQNPPFHPKWKEVSLPAPLSGWNRLPLAQQWLDKNGVEPVKRQQFDAFLQANPAAANVQSEADKESLFRAISCLGGGNERTGTGWPAGGTRRRFEIETTRPNLQSKLPLSATRPGDRSWRSGQLVRWPSSAQ